MNSVDRPWEAHLIMLADRVMVSAEALINKGPKTRPFLRADVASGLHVSAVELTVSMAENPLGAS